MLGAVREARQRQNIAFKEELTFTVRCDAATAKLLEPMQPYFTANGQRDGHRLGPTAEPQRRADQLPTYRPARANRGPRRCQPLHRRRRGEASGSKRTATISSKQIASIDGKLDNKGFVDKAPPEVVQQQREKLAELRGQLASGSKPRSRSLASSEAAFVVPVGEIH